METESGFITNGNDTITVRAVKTFKITGEKNEPIDLPFRLTGGYEFKSENAVIAIIDIRGNNLWFYKDLDEPTRFIIAASSSAILLRKQNH